MGNALAVSVQQKMFLDPSTICRTYPGGMDFVFQGGRRGRIYWILPQLNNPLEFNGTGRTRLRLKLRPCKFYRIFYFHNFPDESDEE
jgi:hypothetical protein